MSITSPDRARVGGLTKLAECAFDLRRQVRTGLAIPAQVRLVEGSTVEGRRQIAASSVSTVSLPPHQFLTQDRHPAAECAKEAPTKVRFLKHQSQHFLGLAHVLQVLFYNGEHCVFHGSHWIAALWRFGKSLRYPLAAVFHAEREELLFAAEVAEKRTPGDAGATADLFDCGPVEANSGKQIPGRLLDLPQDKLMFPFAKRPRILRFRPIFAARRRDLFLHCMQIMAQSAAL